MLSINRKYLYEKYVEKLNLTSSRQLVRFVMANGVLILRF